MKAVEAVKEKFYCFLGIVHPTYYQSRGWGPWLGCTTFYANTPVFKTSHKSRLEKLEFSSEIWGIKDVCVLVADVCVPVVAPGDIHHTLLTSLNYMMPYVEQ